MFFFFKYRHKLYKKYSNALRNTMYKNSRQVNDKSLLNTKSYEMDSKYSKHSMSSTCCLLSTEITKITKNNNL